MDCENWKQPLIILTSRDKKPVTRYGQFERSRSTRVAMKRGMFSLCRCNGGACVNETCPQCRSANVTKKNKNAVRCHKIIKSTKRRPQCTQTKHQRCCTVHAMKTTRPPQLQHVRRASNATWTGHWKVLSCVCLRVVLTKMSEKSKSEASETEKLVSVIDDRTGLFARSFPLCPRPKGTLRQKPSSLDCFFIDHQSLGISQDSSNGIEHQQREMSDPEPRNRTKAHIPPREKTSPSWLQNSLFSSSKHSSYTMSCAFL